MSYEVLFFLLFFFFFSKRNYFEEKLKPFSFKSYAKENVFWKHDCSQPNLPFQLTEKQYNEWSLIVE